MAFPPNPSPGDTYVEDNTTYTYNGPINGWTRSIVSPASPWGFVVPLGTKEYTDQLNRRRVSPDNENNYPIYEVGVYESDTYLEAIA